MFKKVGLTAVSLLLLAAVVYITLHFQNLRQFDTNQQLKAVPADAPVVVVVQHISNTLQALANADSMMTDLGWIGLLADFKTKLDEFLSSPIYKHPELELLLEKPCAVTIYPNGKELSCTFYFSFYDRVSQKKFAKWIKAKGKKEDSDIYSCKLNDNGLNRFVALRDGVLVVAATKENALLAISCLKNHTGIDSNTEFAAVEKTVSKESTANMFVNLERFPTLYSTTVDTKKLPVDFGKIGHWAALDIDLKPSEIGIAGLISSNKVHEAALATLFAQTAPTPSSLVNNLPSETVMASCFNLGTDRAQISQNVDNYMAKLGYAPTNDSIGSLLYGTVCLADIAHKSIIDRVLTIETEGQSKAMEQIKGFLYGSLIDPLVPDTHFEPNENVKIPIYRNLADSVLSGSIGFLFQQVPDKYFTFFENQVVFADSVAPLTRFLYQRILDKTLGNSPMYKSFSASLPANSHFNFFVSPSYLPTLLRHKTTDKTQKRLDSESSKMANFYGLGLQLALADNNILLSHNLSYAPNSKQEPVTLWQSKLDTTTATKPLLITNPKTNQKDILVQDLSSKIYLISSTGVISWEKKIDALIMGDIHLIDFYKNGKNQFAFSAGDKIHVIDFNGNNVANFPVQLPCNATSPLSVFDYEKNNDLRFVVACKDKSVRLFDKQGNRLPDWKFAGTETEVTLPVQHFRVGEKDYLVVTDKNRFYFLDRKGSERTSIANTLSPIAPLVMVSANGDFISVSKTGQILSINLTEAKASTTKMPISPQGTCVLRSFDGTKRALLYADESSIALLDSNGKVEWHKKIEDGLLSTPDIYTFPNGKRKIGVTTKNNQILLFNSDGSLFPGFPMEGMSRFSIGYMKSDAQNFNLIVGGKNHFLYSYEIQIQ